MKKDIHPEYREVLFHDTGADKYFLIRSTLETTQTKEWDDGKTIHIILLKYHLLLILFTLVSKKLLIQVVEYRNLKKGLVRKNKDLNLHLNSQILYYPFLIL